jgi:hypothetical protein
MGQDKKEMKIGLGISAKLTRSMGQPKIYEDKLVRIEEYPNQITLVFEMGPKKFSTVNLPSDLYYKKVLPNLVKQNRVPRDWRGYGRDK